ncbi:MerR family transcriptional regulator [Oceanococcus atlanticus]|uniref:MerR family transcriptional regulator n=1 Tax=Oceanococcus atlanticus TaxID=1317117 RepID=A0A1Y1SCT3_9GAMM|nr:MerR family transcriptional regulator [Oceanococcus atlanticus]ORE86115.1 MerR family transcriptional regulator [Oceanococcus atlanticus]RZO86075.1 MAG: MerR family transcriptional regulator [Oceanococcus sp.]
MHSAQAAITETDLPEIPEKRYFAIGEVSELCLVKPHVLRYWEQEFPQLKPVKRRGNRRYYQYQDVEIVRVIRSLLYEQGFTIDGARKQLKQNGKPGVAASGEPTSELSAIRSELEAILALTKV